MAQLPLELRLKPYASFASFIAGPNRAASLHAQAVAAGARPESLWLHGAAGTGKSHLLAAACREAGEAGFRAIYLALDPQQDPGILGQLEAMDLVALDDVDRVAGIGAWERALFAVFDARLQTGGIIAAAAAPPAECGFGLADLVSRAAAAAVYRLEHLDDDQLLEAVMLHASMRGLSLDQASARFLLTRLSRDLPALTDCLDRIDRYALAAKRRITIPLLREVIRQ